MSQPTFVAQDLALCFGADFLEDHAGYIITDPRIALIELIANAYDAGATLVHLKWPSELGQVMAVEDNGGGMTRAEFEHRWQTLCYKRQRDQGLYADNPNRIPGNPRLAFGKSGKGRHAMFCFSDKYTVTTRRNNQETEITVEKGQDESTPFRCHLERETNSEGHGTRIRAEVLRRLMPEEAVRELIGSKFSVDPSFEIRVNGNPVQLFHLNSLVTKPVVVDGVGEIRVHQIDSDVQDRTVQLRGITWWVNRRTVGTPSWDGLDGEGAYLDGRSSLAKRYSFVVEADVLRDCVKADWSGFHGNEQYNKVRSAVHNHVVGALNDIQASSKKDRKRAALMQTRTVLRELSNISRNAVARFIEQVQEKCPTLSERDLFRTAEIFGKLEVGRSGYDILKQLLECSPDDLDKWNSLMQRWTAGSAELVLNELEARIHTITRMQSLVESPLADELHELQPLFERGLWMFGAEYEAVDFRSNRGLATIVRDFLGGTTESLRNARPDFVALPERSIGLYSAPEYRDGGEISGVRRILIVELKKGGFCISQKELDQARNYAMELRKAADVRQDTEMVGYVLGADADARLEEMSIGRHLVIKPMIYRTLLDRAHSRTFYLQQKLSALGLGVQMDKEIEDVFSEPEQTEFIEALP